MWRSSAFKSAAFKSLAGLLLRGGTLGCKLLLALMLARYLSTDNLGIWVLLNSSAAFAVLVLGLEYFNIANRHYVLAEKGHRCRVLTVQASVYAISYATFIPLLILAAIWWSLPLLLLSLFVGVVVGEHISQEMYRLLIVLERQNEANVILFIRSGLWALLASALLPLASIGVKEIMFMWFVGGQLSILYFWWTAKPLLRGARIDIVDAVRSLPETFRVVAPFIGISVAMRSLSLIDRYLIKMFYSNEEVGVYGFYFSLVSGLQALYDSGAVAVLFPRMLTQWRERNFFEYKKIKKQFFLATIASWSAFIACTAAILHWLLAFVGKPEISEQVSMLWVLFAAQVVFNISIVYHYDLYVRGFNRLLLQGAYVYAVGGAMALGLLVPVLGGLGAAVSMLIASLLLLLARIVQFRVSGVSLMGGDKKLPLMRSR